MRHRNGLNKLGLKPSHRKAMIRNMLTSLFRHESIQTTKAKAKVVQKAAEKMITRAKVDSVHNRREIFKSIKDKEILAKLFTEIGPLFVDRNGGYTRVLKLGNRQGDAAEMALLELVEKTANSDKMQEKKADKKSAKKIASNKLVENKEEIEVEAEIEEAEVVPEQPSTEMKDTVVDADTTADIAGENSVE